MTVIRMDEGFPYNGKRVFVAVDLERIDAKVRSSNDGMQIAEYYRGARERFLAVIMENRWLATLAAIERWEAERIPGYRPKLRSPAEIRRHGRRRRGHGRG